MKNKNEKDTDKDSNEEYKKFAYGMLIVKSSNSNFNADFSGLPRKLPNEEGTFYATDKALKYCIRRYIHDMCPDEKVFTWRRRKETLQPRDIGENYKKLFPSDNEGKIAILKNLLSCVDLRLFGVTYAKGGDDKDAVSFTGPVQISYGVNRFEGNTLYSNQILSPYRNPGERHKDDQQTSIGSESKGLESWYVYDIVINPNNLKDVLGIINEKEQKEGEAKNSKESSQGKNNEKLLLTNKDIGLLKKSLCRAVTYVNTCSKIGSESAMLLFAETKDEKTCPIFPMLKDQVTVTKTGDKHKINLAKAFKVLDDSFKKNEVSYELYYDNNQTEIIGKMGKEFHIRTLENLNKDNDQTGANNEN